MKKLLTFLFIPFTITYALSQTVEIESDSNSTCNRISLEISQGIGLGLVQDRISPMFIYRLGIGINNFKIHLVGSENYFFSTKMDNSIERTVDRYYGIELSPGWIKGKENLGGIGVSYCPNPKSELHEKNPIKAYFFTDLGKVSITTEYIWSNFFYPGISIRFDL